MCVFVALIFSPNCALMFSITETCCCNSLHDLAIRVVSSAYLNGPTYDQRLSEINCPTHIDGACVKPTVQTGKQQHSLCRDSCNLFGVG